MYDTTRLSVATVSIHLSLYRVVSILFLFVFVFFSVQSYLVLYRKCCCVCVCVLLGSTVSIYPSLNRVARVSLLVLTSSSYY